MTAHIAHYLSAGARRRYTAPVPAGMTAPRTHTMPDGETLDLVLVTRVIEYADGRVPLSLTPDRTDAERAKWRRLLRDIHEPNQRNDA